jgi:hypothetical protein
MQRCLGIDRQCSYVQDLYIYVCLQETLIVWPAYVYNVYSHTFPERCVTSTCLQTCTLPICTRTVQVLFIYMWGLCTHMYMHADIHSVGLSIRLGAGHAQGTAYKYTFCGFTHMDGHCAWWVYALLVHPGIRHSLAHGLQIHTWTV